MAAPRKLFVGGLPSVSASVDQVIELFTEHGVVPLEVVILPPKGSNPETRCGFVHVPEEAEEHICQALNGLHFEGHSAPLVVRPADTAKHQTNVNGTNGGGMGAAPLKLVAIHSLGDGPLGREVPLATAVDPTVEKERAKAEGRWIDAVQWQDQEHRRAGETHDAKFRRLSSQLQDAVAAEHFYEAAALYEIMHSMDPGAAASANASAASTCRSPDDRSWGPSAAWSCSGQAEGGSRHAFYGTIVSFQPERHFGFIHCPELGCDAFVSDKQIGSFAIGDKVAFNVTYNAKGQPQAQNLRPWPDGGGWESPGAKRFRSEY